MSNLKYTPDILQGLKDDVLVNYIPLTGFFKIDDIEVLGSRERSVVVYQLLIEIVCNQGDVIIDISGGNGDSVYAANNVGNHILVNESRKDLFNNIVGIVSKLVSNKAKEMT